MTQLWITLTLLTALTLGLSTRADTPTTNNATKGINPVQHSE